jgi:hypothetical protein
MCGLATLTNDCLTSPTTCIRYHNIRRTSAQTVTLAKFIEEMDRYAIIPFLGRHSNMFDLEAHDVSERNGPCLERCG